MASQPLELMNMGGEKGGGKKSSVLVLDVIPSVLISENTVVSSQQYLPSSHISCLAAAWEQMLSSSTSSQGCFTRRRAEPAELLAKLQRE